MKITKKTTLIAAEPAFVGTRIGIAVGADSPKFGIYSAKPATGHESVTVNWGDGCVDVVESVGKLEHEYSAPGDYEVRLSDDIRSVAASNAAAGTPFSDLYPAMITSVESNATNLDGVTAGGFRDCVNLRSMNLTESSVRLFGTSSFSGCRSLAAAEKLPRGMTSLGALCFEGCVSMTAIALPEGIISLLGGVFKGCTALSGRIELPYVTSIQAAAESGPFNGCSGITEIAFALANKTSICASDGYKNDPTLGTGTAVCVFDL